MHSLRRDLHYALRTLRTDRRFAAVVILTLALGLGVTTAVFGVVHAVIIRPLPFREPERLTSVLLQREGRDPVALSYPVYQWWRNRARSFEHVAGNTVPYPLVLTGLGPTDRLPTSYVTDNLFTTLGARPARGRLFTPADDVEGAPLTIIVSDVFWRTRLGADTAAVGRRLELDGKSYEIVGIMPEGFAWPEDASAWRTYGASLTAPQRTQATGQTLVRIVARLRPQVSLEAAAHELDGLIAQFREAEPRYPDYSARAIPLQEAVIGPVRRPLLIFAAAVGVLLLIACTNAASLLAVRAVTREREIVLRAALGASRGRIVRQLLTEAVCLALIAGAIGVLLAFAGTRAFVALAGDALPRAAEVRLDGTALAFIAGVSLLTGLLFGLAPALHLATGSPAAGLRQAGAQGLRPRGRVLTSALIVGEVALAIVLLTGAGLLVRSFATLSGVTLGYDPARVLTADLRLPPSRYPSEESRRAFGEALHQRMSALPGVVAAAVTSGRPFAVGAFGTLSPGGDLVERPHGTVAFFQTTAGYFETLRIPLREGTFLPGDPVTQPGAVVVNEAFVAKFLPHDSPLGKRIVNRGRLFHIVGVVGDTQEWGLDRERWPHVYGAWTEEPTPFVHAMIRTRGAPAALVPALREAITGLDGALPVDGVRELETVIGDSIARPRFYASVVAAVSAIALLLAAIGIYGVMRYASEQRTREMAIRMALGARPGSVVALLVRRGLLLVITGVVLGIGGALAATRALGALLFEVSPTDPAVYAAVAATFVLVAVLATYLPARRAGAVDPTVTLRTE